MRYALKLEAIGDSYEAFFTQMQKTPDARRFDRKTIDAYRFGRAELSSSVSRIDVFDNKLRKTCIKGNKDYTESNNSGNRGIWFYYYLSPGIYEINSRISLSQSRRYFLKIMDYQTALEISFKEVCECLNLNEN